MYGETTLLFALRECLENEFSLKIISSGIFMDQFLNIAQSMIHESIRQEYLCLAKYENNNPNIVSESVRESSDVNCKNIGSVIVNR